MQTEKDAKDIILSKVTKVLNEVLEEHTGIDKKVKKSIIYTFIEAMTTGHASLVDSDYGVINVVVCYDPENLDEEDNENERED